MHLGEDAHRYCIHTDTAVFSFLRTAVMNLLRRGGYSSIRQGFRELANNFTEIFALGGVAIAKSRA